MENQVKFLLAMIVVLTTFVGGCVAPNNEAKIQFNNHARRPGMDSILIAMPPSTNAAEIRSSITEELAQEFDVQSFSVDRGTALDALEKAIADAAPKCLILVNNSTVALYRRLQHRNPNHAYPPAIVVMSSFVEELVVGLRNTTGIAYEIPIVTVFSKMRELLKDDVVNIGLLHRKNLSSFVMRQQELADVEGFRIHSIVVSEYPRPREIRAGVRRLRNAGHLDALWVINDNRLLNKGVLLREGWMPVIEQYSIPVAVGVDSLVNPVNHFGTLAVLPDHEALGVQTADMVWTLSHSDWKASDLEIEQPLSIETVVDVVFARKHLDFHQEFLSHADRVVE